MKLKKILGFLLLFLGIAIIFWSLYSSYNIFMAKKPPPEVFKVEEKMTQKTPAKTGNFDIQAQMEKIFSEKIKGLLPIEFLNKILNLIAWSIFVGILIFGGGQIATLGIRLIG